MNPARSRKPLVLLAEDDGDLRELFSRRLQAEGLAVDEAEDGLELIDSLELRRAGLGPPVDLVVSDLNMPGKDPLSTLAAFGALGVPVVLVSAFIDPYLRAEAGRFGIRHVVDKPVDLDDLAALVVEALAERRPV